MQLRYSEFYLRRDGLQTKITRHYPGVKYLWGSDLGDRYMDDGRYDQFNMNHPKDLIQEVGTPILERRIKVGQPNVNPLTANPTPAPTPAPVSGTSKHAYFIKAWAEGATIQCKGPDATEWHDILAPGLSIVKWRDDCEFRLKPAAPTLVTMYAGMFENDSGIFMGPSDYSRTAIGDGHRGVDLIRVKKLVVDYDTREVVSEEWILP